MPEGTSGTEDFDERCFLALFRLAGPLAGRELADRLDKDLTMISQAFAKVQHRPDRQVLRAQSHVLLAIAGTVGARRLNQLAERLNTIARTQDSADTAELLAEIQKLIGLLIRRVHALPLDMVPRS